MLFSRAILVLGTNKQKIFSIKFSYESILKSSLSSIPSFLYTLSMGIPMLHMTLFELITSVGYVGLFLIVFAESSLFFSFFLPGSSLLFTAGVLAGQGFFNIYVLTTTLALAGILGDSFGYWFGTKVGPTIFSREDSRFFNKKHL